MKANFDLLVRGGTLVSAGGQVKADVAISGGRIAAVGTGRYHAAEVIDAHGLHVLPGVIDSQVHFREPGHTHKEDISSGSAAAALGGVTSFFEMPNTTPPTTTAEALAWKVARANETSWVDFAFYVGATASNLEALAALERAPGCAGVKCFLGSSTGDLLLSDTRDVERLLTLTSRRAAFHSEDDARLKERKALCAGQSVAFHPDWRDVETAVRSTRRLLEMAQRLNRRVHVLHVTTAEEVPLLEAAREFATFEVTPQHLTLAAPECYARLGTLAQMNPPIRDGRHRKALWQAVNSGAVTMLGSDHAPHTREEKAKAYPDSPSGMPGVQTLLPVMLNHVNAGALTLERLVGLTSTGPARAFGIANKGSIHVGFDADLTLVDLKHRWRVEAPWLKSRCGWSPFEGEELTGRPVVTLVRGRAVARDGALNGTPQGRPVSFSV